MKKIFTILLLLIFSSNVVYAKEYMKLYSIRNTTQGEAERTIKSYLKSENIKYNQYQNLFVLTEIDPNEYTLIYTKKIDDTCEVFAYSDTTKSIVNDLKNILKSNTYFNIDRIKTDGKLEQYKINALIAYTNFKTSAQNSPQKVVYDFSDEAQAKFNNRLNNNVRNKKEETIKSYINSPSNYQTPTNVVYQNALPSNNKSNYQATATFISLPAGSTFPITLQSSVSSASMMNGDAITALVSKDIKMNGQIIIPKDSLVYGTVSDAQQAGYMYKDAQVVFLFNKLMFPNGEMHNISTEKIVYSSNKNTKGTKVAKTASNTVTGAVVGALFGLALYAVSDDLDVGEAIAIGAGSGAAIGATSSALTKGSDVDILEGEIMTLKLLQPINVSTKK